MQYWVLDHESQKEVKEDWISQLFKLSEGPSPPSPGSTRSTPAKTKSKKAPDQKTTKRKAKAKAKGKASKKAEGCRMIDPIPGARVLSFKLLPRRLRRRMPRALTKSRMARRPACTWTPLGVVSSGVENRGLGSAASALADAPTSADASFESNPSKHENEEGTALAHVP